MDAVTYPHAAVIAEVTEKFVPVKLESAKNADVSRKMGIRWLPGLVVADADERVTHFQIGFLPPKDLVLELGFGRAIWLMAQKRYDDAHALFQTVAETPHAERAPEAYFWWGISRYRQIKDLKTAIEGPWGEILRRWPDSQWSRKVGYALGQPAGIA